jgi:hypothetical protein
LATVPWLGKRFKSIAQGSELVGQNSPQIDEQSVIFHARQDDGAIAPQLPLQRGGAFAFMSQRNQTGGKL